MLSFSSFSCRNYNIITASSVVDKFIYKFYTIFVMQLPTIKSISDIRKKASIIFDQIHKKDEVVLVTKNNDMLSVIVSPQYFQSMVEENETLWEELEMSRSKKATAKEPVYKLQDVIDGKV